VGMETTSATTDPGNGGTGGGGVAPPLRIFGTKGKGDFVMPFEWVMVNKARVLVRLIIKPLANEVKMSFMLNELLLLPKHSATLPKK